MDAGVEELDRDGLPGSPMHGAVYDALGPPVQFVLQFVARRRVHPARVLGVETGSAARVVDDGRGVA